MIAILPLVALLLSLAILVSLAKPRYLSTREAEPKTISVIIPARDEEENIGRLLSSLKNQADAPLEILVVDDQSNDDTASVATELGATVVRGGPMPDGWKGKTWACQQGADAASGEWLLYLDADLVLLPGALSRLAALTSRKEVHSVCPYHRVHRPYEELSAYFNAITLAGVDSFAFGPSSRATLFGQVLLIHRDHYREAGGHHAVRNEILENFQLARLLNDAGIGISHYLGRSAIEMRMFPDGISRLIRSWQKGFLAGAAQAPKRALVTTSLWLTGGMVLTGCLTAAPFWSALFLQSTLVASFSYCLLTWFVFRLAGNFSFFTALLFPIPLLFYQGVFFSALVARKRGIKATWKGRTID